MCQRGVGEMSVNPHVNIMRLGVHIYVDFRKEEVDCMGKLFQSVVGASMTRFSKKY